MCQIEQNERGFGAIIKGCVPMQTEQEEFREVSLADVKNETAMPRWPNPLGMQ